MEAGVDVRLWVVADGAREGERVRVSWTVNGRRAGSGESIKIKPPRSGKLLARAVATGESGATTAREWHITVNPAPPAAAGTPAGERKADDREPDGRRSASEIGTQLATRSAVPLPATGGAEDEIGPETEAVVAGRSPDSSEPPPARTTAQEITQFLDAYTAAWRNRDLESLKRLGQFSSEEQAAVVGRYLATARDLEVQVEILGVDTQGDRHVVRFRRTDHFLDPGGRPVSQVTPPIEKEIVRTPAGLRFATPPR
jgi:hypothetical protein